MTAFWLYLALNVAPLRESKNLSPTAQTISTTSKQKECLTQRRNVKKMKGGTVFLGSAA
jgi:hypothetical protein